MSTQTDTSLPFGGILDDVSGVLLGANAAWMRSVRAAGLARYTDTGLPTTRWEAWKYTRLSTLETGTYRLSVPDDAAGAVDVLPGVYGTGDGQTRLVFVNGHFRADLSSRDSLPRGVICESLIETMARDDAWLERHVAEASGDADNPLVSLNAAAMQDGFVVHVPRGVAVEGAVEIVFVGGLTDDALAFFPRNIVVMEENARARIIVHRHDSGAGVYFANAVNAVTVKQGANLGVATFHEEGSSATVFSASSVLQERDSVFNSFALSTGGEISRHEQHVVLAGRGASCQLDGAYMIRGTGHCDHTTLIEHRVPDATSNEMFKGVLDDEARAVFQGKIIVHPDARHTDSRMLNKTLLLGDRAEIDSKPELEIYADDVTCTHGATSGQVDETALFYLQSRGIPECLARSLLVQSFLGEVTGRIEDAAVRDAALDRITSWLSRGSVTT